MPTPRPETRIVVIEHTADGPRARYSVRADHPDVDVLVANHVRKHELSGNLVTLSEIVVPA